MLYALTYVQFPRIFGQFPNIKGRLLQLTANASVNGASASSALYYAIDAQNGKTQISVSSNIPADPAIDLSKCNSLYQNDLNEVRVNAVFGLNLIRAF